MVRRGTKLWLRQHRLSIGDRHVYVLNRDFPSDRCCELCGKIARRLNYHHWGEVNLGEDMPVCGMWICNVCHSFAHRIEDGWVIRYTKLKEKIENERFGVQVALGTANNEKI